jgi:hypothetical protein
VRSWLTESAPLGDTLPATRIAITLGRKDWTILDVVDVP